LETELGRAVCSRHFAVATTAVATPEDFPAFWRAGLALEQSICGKETSAPSEHF